MSVLPHRETVRPEWIDYNGHLSEPYYVLVFGHATDVLMEHVGLGRQYRADTKCSLYTVEAHVRYLREVALGSELVVTTRVLGAAGSRVHYCLEMRVDGNLVATEELLGVHVDGVAGRAAPMPDTTRKVLEEIQEDAPEYAGRAVRLHRQT
jgi:acyl-CoA thioester hydrolase